MHQLTILAKIWAPTEYPFTAEEIKTLNDAAWTASDPENQASPELEKYIEEAKQSAESWDEEKRKKENEEMPVGGASIPPLYEMECVSRSMMDKLEELYIQHITNAEIQDGESWSDSPSYNTAMDAYMESIVSHLVGIADALQLDNSEADGLTHTQLSIKHAPARARYFYSQWPGKPRALPPPTVSCVQKLSHAVSEYSMSWTEVSDFLYSTCIAF